MKGIQKIIYGAAFTGVMFGAMPNEAQAASAICPPSLGASTDSFTDAPIIVTRQWELVIDEATTVTCQYWGEANLSSNDELALVGAGGVKTDGDPGAGEGTGIQLDSDPTNSEVNFHFIGGTTDYTLLFKFGGGLGVPDWIIFAVTGVANGDVGQLSLVEGVGGGLSHFTVWGDDNPPEIPEPTSLLLLGSGLSLTAAKLRRRKKT